MNHNIPLTDRALAFISKAQKRFPNLVFDKTVYTNTYTPVVITCKDHGDFTFTPKELLMKGVKAGCPICRDALYKANTDKQRGNVVRFLEKANEVHGSLYDYSGVEYVNAHTKVSIICKDHGVFFQSPVNHTTHKQGCPQCTFASKGEREILRALNDLGVSYTKEYRVTIGNSLHKLDFVLDHKKVVIEFDGEQHRVFKERFHKTPDGLTKLQQRDALKDLWAAENGFTMVRLSSIRTAYRDVIQLCGVV